jgi:hypothetical protein
LVFIASANSQFTTDAFDKGSTDLHPQPLAGGWIKSFR